MTIARWIGPVTGAASLLAMSFGAAFGQMPPTAGSYNETAASLSCVYQLVSPVAGCDPNNAALASNTTLGAHAIALVTYRHYPTLASDLAAYSTQFGLPAANLSVITSPSAASCSDQFDSDINSDSFSCHQRGTDVLEMAHAMAPGASLVLVEMASNDVAGLGPALDTATQQVKALGGGEVIIGTRFGGSAESTFQTSNIESHVTPSTTLPGVIYFASTGGPGAPSYPGTSPNIVSVGGTEISRNRENPSNMGVFLREATSQSSTGGFSALFARPTYQAHIASRLGNVNSRAVPDVAAGYNGSANIWVYNSGGWYAASGPYMALGIAAGIANAARASETFKSAPDLLASVYAKIGTSSFYDVGIGVCGAYDSNNPTVLTRGNAYNQYDLCTGAGAPRGLTGFKP